MSMLRNIVLMMPKSKTLTVYPDANPETVSVDGRISNSSAASWAACRDALDGNDVSDAITAIILRTRLLTGTYQAERGFLLFDTSVLGASVTISAAVLSLAANAESVIDDNSDSIHIVSSTPASNTGLALADFDQVGSVSFASKTLAAWNDGAGVYNDFSLNASGIANINKTGVSKFAVRLGTDLNNIAPTGLNYFGFRAAESASAPKLVITY